MEIRIRRFGGEFFEQYQKLFRFSNLTRRLFFNNNAVSGFSELLDLLASFTPQCVIFT